MRKGDKLSFTGTGQIQWGVGKFAGPEGSTDKLAAARFRPAYPVSTIGAGALIGKVGSGLAFAVGKAANIVADGTGTLYLGINDNSYGDNKGQFSVSIALAPAQ